MDIIKKYFPNINATQETQFATLDHLYKDWNGRINVISRKDIDNLYIHHVLHSLAIVKFTMFKADTKVLDVGTGGGFPGIPLAILFPDVRFRLIDGIAKKIKVVQAIMEALGLQNVTAQQGRIEDEKGKYDFVVSRAVMTLPTLVKSVKKNMDNQQHNAIPNGLICLKGGDVRKETAPFAKSVIIQNLSDYFEEEFFETKKIIYLPV